MTKNLTFNDIKWGNYFYYDESSPSCLRWAVEIRAGSDYKIIRAKAGDVAGSLSKKDGYWRVFLNRKSYLVHKVITAIVNGPSCNCVVDHIDGNRGNNKLSNLRLVASELNSRNTGVYRTNTSGTTGVKFKSTHGGRYLNWEACVETSNGRVSKSFSVVKYGYDTALKLAREWRENMIKELNLQGAGYTERHGKS